MKGGTKMGDEEINKVVEMYPDSIEYSKNAKGEHSWSIKVRFKPDTTAEAKVKAMTDIDALLTKATK